MRKRGRKPLSQDLIDDIIKLKLEGKTQIDISEILFVSTATVWKYLKLNGLTKNQGRGE